MPSVPPSERPSSLPTVSSAPTILYYATLRGNTIINLDGIGNTMNTTQIGVFQEEVKFFIQQTISNVLEGAVLVTSVTVLTQEVMEFDDPEHGHKHKQLIIQVQVEAEYESLIHPDDISFEQSLVDTFEMHKSLFKTNLLETKDPFYEGLNPHEVDTKSGMSSEGYIALIACSIAASILAILASYYAIKRAKAENLKGDKLSEMNMYNDGVDSDISADDIGVPLQGSKSIEIIKVSSSPDKAPQGDRDADDDDDDTKKEEDNAQTKPVTPRKESTNNSIEVDSLDNKHASMKQQVNSPNTMEMGRLGALAESILRSESFGSNLDPPESNRYKYEPKTKGDPAANYRRTPPGVPRPDAAPPGNRVRSQLQ